MRYFILLLLLSLGVYAFEPHSTGVLLVHGKGGMPTSTWESFQAALEKEGFVVIAKEMPWSKERYLDKSYEASIEEIHGYLKELHSQNLKHIVLIGHSLGANVSIAYASLHPLDAMVSIAPGHNPIRTQAYFKSSVELAKRMMEEGKGSVVASFADTSANKQFMKEMPADIYYSFFSPTGLGAMSLRAALLPKSLPVLYLAGKDDPLTSKNGTETFDAMPKTPQSQYRVIEGDHKSVIQASQTDVIGWLKGL